MFGKNELKTSKKYAFVPKTKENPKRGPKLAKCAFLSKTLSLST